MRTRPLSVLLVALSFACGAHDPNTVTNEAYTALARGDYEAAIDGFEGVLEDIDASHAAYTRARMGAIEAWIHLDPDEAREDFLAFAERSEAIGEKDYRQVGSELVGAAEFMAALAVIHAGVERFGESEEFSQTMDAIRLAAADDERVASELESLGYVN